jgi:hypothetical protein
MIGTPWPDYESFHEESCDPGPCSSHDYCGEAPEIPEILEKLDAIGTGMLVETAAVLPNLVLDGERIFILACNGTVVASIPLNNDAARAGAGSR